jgi:pyrroloquinoline quinone (PQQ) biosynthesis protein C
MLKIANELIQEIKVLANEHHATAEIQYFFNTRFTPARARCWIIHQTHFVRNRRDCWALAMGQAPLDVKREIWLHEQDELIADPRAGGTDHYTLMTKEARALGVTREEIESAELHPFVIATLEAWLNLGKRTWLESFCSASILEVVNSNAVVRGGGFSSKVRAKLVSEAGIPQELLIARNVHVEADQEHATILDRVLLPHVHNEWDRKLALDAIKKSLDIHRAYRAGVAFAMQQIPADEPAK